MAEAKDPAIKLFGKTIQLPEEPETAADGGGGDGCVSSLEADSNGVAEECESGNDNKDVPEEKPIDKEEDRADSAMPEKVKDLSATLVLNENPKTLSVESESATAKTSKTVEEQSDASNSQEKTLKKPDKILPCPRCNSMDTKFCYFNNYNVNQPRHFCKNCQRYWTAGGTMRNVPVGAGRRKNKTLAPQYTQITVTEALPSGPHHPILNPNGTVLKFGPDTPLCNPVDSASKIAEKPIRQNGFHKPGFSSNGDDNSSGSSVTEMQNLHCHGFSPQVPCFPGVPWPYPWNPQMGPTFCPPGFPMPFYPAAPYWGCAVPGTWNVPWIVPPPIYHATPHCDPNSPSLGKHSREENMVKPTEIGEKEALKESEPEKRLWVPKTLRIDDPEEAAKSSIWATLGIKNDRFDSQNGGGFFKTFKSKGEEKNLPTKETSSVLQANPAALSRSLNFQESS